VHLVLGAGCAGLSLACALLDAGVGERIVLVDRRTAFANDRTWCFWDTRGDLPFARWPPTAGRAGGSWGPTGVPASTARIATRTCTCRPTCSTARRWTGSPRLPTWSCASASACWESTRAATACA
jgi:glycine/D-amino acid oxidase-like deaminating enzyme